MVHRRACKPHLEGKHMLVSDQVGCKDSSRVGECNAGQCCGSLLMHTSCRGQDRHLQLKRCVLRRALVVSRHEGAGGGC